MKASADISLRYTDQLNPHSSPSGTMRYIPPIYQAKWSDGRYAPGKDGVNPYAALMSAGEKESDKYLANAKFQLDITPVKGLTVTGIFSPQFSYTKIKDFQRQTSYFSYQEESLTSSKYISSALTTELEEDRGDTFAHTTQVYANYRHTFGEDHNFSAMIGYENYWYQEGTIVAKNTSYAHSLIPDLNAGNSDGVTANSKNINELARRSYFGRLMYNYKSKYYVQGNIRRDGSSRFAPGHQWGYFPSLATAWRISEEKFMQNAKWVDNLKLRVSAGMLGNQNIGDYSYAAQISQGGSGLDYVFGNSLASGAVYSSISNPDLTWEKAKQLDIGLDFGLFGNRIAGTIEGYYKRTNDLLWTVPLPKESGYTSSMTNVGVLDNKGIEFTLNTVNLNLRNFQWTSSFNISYNHNEIIELYDGKQDVNKSLFVGHSLGEFYLLRSQGIWQIDEAGKAAVYGAYPGDRKILDKEPNNVINGEDRMFAGQSTPTWYGGFTNTFRFYGVDVTLFMNFAGGHMINNTLLRSQNSYNVWGNMSRDYYNGYWRTDRPSNIYPAPRVGSAYANGDGTDANLQDGKYLRIKNLEVGYTLPKRWTDAIRANSIRVFFSVQNLATFTAYTGYDVEAWDNTNPYPGSRSFIGGVSINF